MRRARRGVMLALCVAAMCAVLLVAGCSDSSGGGGDDDTQDVNQQEQQEQQETFDSPDIFVPLNGVKSTTTIRLDILSNGNGVNFPLSSLETARAFEAHKTVIRYMNNPPATQSELLEYANATNLWSSLTPIIPIVGTPTLHSLTNRTIDFSSLAPGDWVLWIQTNGTAKSDISYTVYVDGVAVAGQEVDDSLSDVSVVMPERGINKDYTFKGELTGKTFQKILYSITCVGDPITLDFSRCTGYLPDDIYYVVSSSAKLNKIVLPGCLKKIPYRFADHSGTLKSVVISDGTTEIGEEAFYYCASLKSVVIPSGVREIGEGAFCICESLESVTIPEGVTTIEKDAFSNCTSLKSVVIPDSVTQIGEAAFYKCTLLESVVIPSGVKDISASAFYKCTSLESVTIPEGVTNIGSDAFSDCTSLKSVTIPEGVATIERDAFSDCTGIKSLTIPASVEKVDSYAFLGWTSEQTITVPWAEGNKPPYNNSTGKGWNYDWNHGCSAAIIYNGGK